MQHKLFLSHFFITHQKGTNFNAGKKLSIGLSHSLSFISIKTYFSIEESSEKTLSLIFWTVKNRIQKDKYQLVYDTFLEF